MLDLTETQATKRQFEDSSTNEGDPGDLTLPVLLAVEGKFRAMAEDLGFGWRWEIFQEDILVQVGCSLSMGSANEAVRHVLAFFRNSQAAQEQTQSG
jgi:soluble methane monooxygenase-binding protein MmoD